MRISIFHAYLYPFGGATVFALNLYKALKRIGYRPTIYAFDEMDEEMEKMTGNGYKYNIVKLKEKSVAKIMKRTGRFVRLTFVLSYGINTDEIDGDIKIDTQSNIPLKGMDASYIHFPTVLEQVATNPLHNIYNKIIRYYVKKYIDRKPKNVLTNSFWTANYIKKAYHIPVCHEDEWVDAHGCVSVLYPPVPQIAPKKKAETFVTIARITPGKNIESVFNVAKRFKNMDFYIFGSLYKENKRDIEYYNHLERTKPDNVIIMPNANRKLVEETLARSMFYLHPKYKEHFGISVVEAMSAGAIPFVYVDSGSWHDIVSRTWMDILKYNLMEDITEERIKYIIDNYDKISKKVIEVAKIFSYEAFVSRLKDIMDIVIRGR